MKTRYYLVAFLLISLSLFGYAAYSVPTIEIKTIQSPDCKSMNWLDDGSTFWVNITNFTEGTVNICT